MQSKQTRKHKLGNREQTDGGKCRQTLAAQAAKTEQFKQQRQQCQRQPQLNNDLIFNLRISRELRIIQFVYTVRNIPNRICKTALKFEKESLQLDRRIVYVFSNVQNRELKENHDDNLLLLPLSLSLSSLLLLLLLLL